MARRLSSNPEICREIAAGNSLDVIEIDGASNNSVDQVRDLRESVGYAPARARFKIYIIDEVHMLSIAAFNALLKTLEEPPAHVKFMFATTEPQKVPATILSRCQRFDLRRISSSEIMKKLGEIAIAEGVNIDEAALLAISRGAEGGLRDAESALDQLIAFRGENIKEDDVLSVFGLVSWEFLETLAGGILKGDFKTIIETVSDLDQHGKDMHRLLIELMEYYRNLLVFMVAGKESTLEDLTSAQIEKLSEQKQNASPERILEIVEILTETESQLRFALSKRTLFETALIRCARAASVVSIDEIIKQINELKQGLSVSPPTSAPAATVQTQANKPNP
ncbi:MAG: DNA polymerase III subunit gamma/tau, partial [Verrucomicrobiota bacterium]